MIDLRRCPKTATLLEERGVVLVEGKPKLTEAWLTAREPHLRGAKKEHKERQEALVPFRVLFALWEDQVGNSTYLMQCALGMAKRNPQPAMRQALPRLEQEARKFFILPARRRALRELITQLDQATAHLKDLPLTAMASVESANLPLPTQTLPALREDAEGRGRWVRGGWVQKLKRFFGS